MMTLQGADYVVRLGAMKVSVSPLVLAAALGLLGPAALEDSDESSISGLWKRTDGAKKKTTGKGLEETDDGNGLMGALGDHIEVITVEDRVLIGDGSGQLDGGSGQWTTVQADLLVQEMEVGGAQIVRQFTADGDNLHVEVRVERDGVTAERWTSHYERITTLG
jgi:hypothetical protein